MNDTRVDIELTPVGQRRREAMLEELIRTMRTVHRRRWIRRGLAFASLPALALGAVAALWLARNEVKPSAPLLVHQNDAPKVASPRRSASTIVRVQSDPSLLERYRAASRHHAIVLDDDSLLAALDALNRPAGIIRTASGAWLTRPVADDATGLAPPDESPSS